MTGTCGTCWFYCWRIASDGVLIYRTKSLGIGYCARPVKTWWGGIKPINEQVDDHYGCEKHQPKETPDDR